MVKRMMTMALVVAAASGCAVTFQGSAPAAGGGRYVVGSKSNQKAMFLCPDQPSKGDCEDVEVEYR